MLEAEAVLGENSTAWGNRRKSEGVPYVRQFKVAPDGLPQLTGQNAIPPTHDGVGSGGEKRGGNLCMRVNLPRAQIINFFGRNLDPGQCVHGCTYTQNEPRIFFSMSAGYSGIVCGKVRVATGPVMGHPRDCRLCERLFTAVRPPEVVRVGERSICCLGISDLIRWYGIEADVERVLN